MKIQELINEVVGYNRLYHSLKPDFAVQALTKNLLEGRTTQRFWPDGRRLKDNNPEYDNSFWFKGISTTRDRQFAEGWNMVVFELDKAEIQKTHKIIPFNWGYSIPRDNDHKREREEFIVTSRIYKTQQQMKDEYAEYVDSLSREEYLAKRDSLQLDWMFRPEGKPVKLDKCLKGIYVDKDILNYSSLFQKDTDFLQNHPKFLGFYE